ncbi:MAG TPA: hypothetical protein VHK01_04105, partial [Lacipirellulaceae bacterium]|nr:hypothetical protein [Lacipirellulaceae bacterium]
RLSHGKVTVSGPGSTWTSTGSLSVGSFVNTTAELLIENGGRVISNSSPGSSGFDSGIGVFILSKGIVNVTGAGSTWTHNASLNVGGQGTGTLSISNGGRVVSLGGVVSTGSPFGGGVGTSSATVSGPGSTWVNNGPLTVGSGLPGTLTIADGGHVSSTSGFIASQSFSNGAASVTGNGSAWTISDDLIVGGSSTSISGGAGTLSIGPGSNVSVGDQIVIHQQGQLKLEGGSLAATAIRRGPFGLGLFNWTAGTLHVGSFEGSLTNSAGILAPGRSPGSTTITGDYTQQAGGALEIEIGGTLPGTGYDAVSVNLRATLGGQLQLALIGGFVPGQANIFTVLMANTGLTGAFANVVNGQRLATSDGTGSFLVHYGATSAFNPRHVVLTNFQSTLLPGDFNHDGNVDAADYVVWRRNPSGNTLVDTTNYNTWRANFGRTAAQIASSTSVPEPESLAFVGALLSVVVFTRARRY